MAKPALPPKPNFIKPKSAQQVGRLDRLKTERCEISYVESTEWDEKTSVDSNGSVSFRSYYPTASEKDSLGPAVTDSSQHCSLLKARVSKSEMIVTHKINVNKLAQTTAHTSSSTSIGAASVEQRGETDCEIIPLDATTPDHSLIVKTHLDHHTSSYQWPPLEDKGAIVNAENTQSLSVDDALDNHLEVHPRDDEAIGRSSRNSTISTDTSSSNDSVKPAAPPVTDHSPSDSVWSSLEPKSLKVAFEIVQTEYDYLQSLNLLLTDFVEFVRGSAPPEELSLLLKGLPEMRLFCEDLYTDLRIHLEQYPVTRMIAPVFLKKGKVLILYVQYVKDFEKLIGTYQSLLKRYPAFNEAVSRFEASPACKKIPLLEYFHKPIQRLPRYPLLLGSYLRALENDHPDRENAKLALDLVSDVTAKANTTLASLDKVHRLLWYQSRTMEYTFLRPDREFICDGTLRKLSRKSLQERTVILCSDALICLETLTSNKFVLNGEFPLIEIRVDNLIDNDYFDRDLEFAVHSQRKSFVLQAGSIEERNVWLNAIRRALGERQKLLSQKVSGNSQVDGTDSQHFAPIWIPDYRVQACQLCKKPFGLFRRYHHCRLCGYAVCSSCSPHEVNIDYKHNRSKRVCRSCFARH